MGERQIKPIDSNIVKSLFNYKDGSLYWAVKKGRAEVGTTAKPNNTGYKTFKINGKRYLEHRLIWAWHNMPYSDYLDHINNNPLDNRIENLRAATHSQNMRNTKIRKDNKSGVKGVYWQKEKNRWKVQIWANGKQRFVGLFKEISDATKAATTFRINNHQSFSNLGI